MSKQVFGRGFDPAVETFLKLVLGRQAEVLIVRGILFQGTLLVFCAGLSRSAIAGAP
jgi:hypothetical protein